MNYLRLYSDARGDSHFEDCELNFELVDFAPPAPPLELSVFGGIGQSFVLRAMPGWQGDWHPVRSRQWHFYLAGEIEVESSDGEIRRLGAGDIALVEDKVGSGHRSRVVGKSRVLIAAIVPSDTEI